MVQEQWQQLKMKFLLGYNIKTVTLWGKLTFAGGVYWGEFFQVVGGECPNFWLVGEGLPPPYPPVQGKLCVWLHKTVGKVIWKRNVCFFKQLMGPDPKSNSVSICFDNNDVILQYRSIENMSNASTQELAFCLKISISDIHIIANIGW